MVHLSAEICIEQLVLFTRAFCRVPVGLVELWRGVVDVDNIS